MTTTFTVTCACGFAETWPTWADADLRAADHARATDHATDIDETETTDPEEG